VRLDVRDLVRAFYVNIIVGTTHMIINSEREEPLAFRPSWFASEPLKLDDAIGVRDGGSGAAMSSKTNSPLRGRILHGLSSSLIPG